MIFLAGLAAGPPEFTRLAALFPDARVVPLPETTADTLPTIARALADTLPSEPLDIVGASFGGLVALALPRDRVRSLTTIGTLPWTTNAAGRCRRFARLLAMTPDRIYREWYRRRVTDSLADDGADSAILDAVRLPPRDVLRARLRAIARYDLPPLPRFPTSFLWGATDAWVTWTTGSLAERGLEGIVVPGGHRPHLSHPSEVAAWISSRSNSRRTHGDR